MGCKIFTKIKTINYRLDHRIKILFIDSDVHATHIPKCLFVRFTRRISHVFLLPCLGTFIIHFYSPLIFHADVKIHFHAADTQPVKLLGIKSSCWPVFVKNGGTLV